MNTYAATAKEHLLYLRLKAKNLGKEVLKVCNPILVDPRFVQWSASTKAWQHHYGEGGLVTHTADVVGLCLFLNGYYDEQYTVDTIELFFAAFFHDLGKMYDYEPVNYSPVDGFKNANWQGTEHKRLIHHISRSGLIWNEMARRSQPIYDKYHDKVLHAILAHHGMRERGSPVAPKTRVAWLVHHCDSISARMNDADTLDIVHREEPAP